jgi:multidrug resistance efflux pump
LAPLAALAAGGAFWLLSHGGATSSMSVRGYADSIDHPMAPLMATGRVTKVLVTVGQRVKAGDPLVQMESRELDVKLVAARSQLAQSQVAVDAAEVNARLAMARAEQLVFRTNMSASQSQAQLTEVRNQLTRLQKLADEQLVQAQVVEQAKIKEEKLAAGIESFKNATRQRQAGLGRAVNEKVTIDEVEKILAPVREAIHQQESALKLAELALDETTLRSRVDGVVTMILHWEGDVVSAGTEVIRVVTARPGLVISWLPERLSTKISVGDPAELRGAGLFAKRFSGRVENLAPEIEEVPIRARTTSTVPAWGRRVFIATSPDRPLVPGEALNVRF